jgi:hypothetical protein
MKETTPSARERQPGRRRPDRPIADGQSAAAIRDLCAKWPDPLARFGWESRPEMEVEGYCGKAITDDQQGPFGKADRA